MIRPNINPAAARQDEGIVRDLVYRKEYILYRDLGIIKRGGRHPYRTSSVIETYIIQGQETDWGVINATSAYPNTISIRR